MDSIDPQRISDAVYGFVSSVGQTGSNLQTNVADAFGHLNTRIQNNLPDKLVSAIPGLKRPVETPPPPSFYDYFPRAPKWLTRTHAFRICAEKPWISAAVTVAVAAAAVAGGIYAYRRFWPKAPSGRRSTARPPAVSAHLVHENQRRTARKTADGAREEAVLIVGSPHAQLVQLVAQDLNIRGFVVYITCGDAQAEHAVEKHRSEDVRALAIGDAQSPEQLQTALYRFSSELDTPIAAFPGATPNKLSLSGVLIIVDQLYPSGPLETVPYEHWNHTLQSNVLFPIKFLGSGGIELVRRHSSRIALVSPVIIGSLSLPFYAAEATVHGALKALSLSLYRELSRQYIPFTEIRVGSFDTRNVKTGTGANANANSSIQADILGWPESMRRIYGRSYRASARWSSAPTQGSPLLTLFFAVFDTLKAKNPPRIVHAGQGSRCYDFLGSWAPSWLITMLARSAELK